MSSKDEADTAQLITQETSDDGEAKADESNKTEDPDDQKHEDKNDNNTEVRTEGSSEDRVEAITADEDPVLQAAMSPSFEESSSFEEMDKKKRLKKMLINVIVLGMSFLLMYTAFQTMNGILQNVIDGYIHYHPSAEPVNGLVSLGIFYFVAAIANWITPAIMVFTGAKMAILIGGLVNTLYIGMLIFAPKAIPIYIFSVFIGISGGLVWVGQGTLLIINSTKATISRNTGIFYFMFESSLVVGNTFIYIVFNGEKYIDDETRKISFGVLTVVSLLGSLTILGLRNVPQILEDENEDKKPETEENQIEEAAEESRFGESVEEMSKWKKAKKEASGALSHSWKLMKTKDIIFQSFMWGYNGLEITFWSGVFPTCIGQTRQLENRFGVVGLAGILVGVGEILGAGVTMLTGNKEKPPRGPLVCIGMVCHAVAFYLCYLTLPEDSPTNTVGTDALAWIFPTEETILIISFLLGFGDGIFQNQICSLIGLLYPKEEDAASSFAIFQFVQCLFAAAAFFYSSYIGLSVQLGILAVMLCMGVCGYLTTEIKFA